MENIPNTPSHEELRIVRVTKILGKWEFLSEDVFNNETIKVNITGKIRMHFFEIPIEKIVYVIVQNSDIENARYIYSWRALVGKYRNIESPLQKQKRILKSKFVDLFGEYKMDW